MGNKIFKRFLLSYIMILIIPIIIGNIIYYETLKTVEKEILESSLSALNQCCNILDRRLEEIDSMITQLDWNSKINELLNMDRLTDGPNVYKVRNVKNELIPYIMTNNFIEDFYIYFTRGEIIVSPYTSYNSIPTFYKYFFSYTDMSYNEFYHRVLISNNYKKLFPAMRVVIKGRPHNYITYVQSFPLNNFSKPKGNIIVLINDNEVQKLLKNARSEGGWAYIKDRDGQVITIAAEPDTSVHLIEEDFVEGPNIDKCYVNGQRAIVIHTMSAYNGLSYVAVLPEKAILQKIVYIKRYAMTITLFNLAFGIVLAYFLAYRNSKPLKELILMIRSRIFDRNENTCQNEYEFLKGTVAALIENNESLKESIKEQQPFFRNAIIYRILKGGVHNIGEINSLLSYVDLELEYDGYCVIVIHIKGYNDMINDYILEDLSVVKAVIRNMINEEFRQDFYILDFEIDKIALLVGLKGGNAINNDKSIINSLRHIYEVLYSQYHIMVSIGIGNTYDRITDVYKSFNESEQAASYKFNKDGNNIHIYSRILKDSSGYYYPIDSEARLMHLVKSGEQDEVEQELKFLYRENFLIRNLSVNDIRHLFEEMKCTLIKILNEITIDDNVLILFKEDIERLDCNGIVDEFYRKLIGMYRRISHHINEQKKNHSVILQKEILDYINKNFMDPDLSLHKVSAQFNLTEVYLSQFFKDKIGENFINYVTSLRIQYSQKLLVETDQSINEIAEAAGYNGDNTFRRAFKRMCGISPSVYRELNR